MAIQAGKAKRVEAALMQGKPASRLAGRPERTRREDIGSDAGAGLATATRASGAAPARPSVARAEIVDKATRARFEEELDAALKRKPASEAKLAGALRAVATISPALRSAMAEAAQIMVRRGSYSRELYGACVRTLAEADDRRVAPLLKTALAAEEAGGISTLTAASFCRDPSLAGSLAKLAVSQRAHVAFSAETARVCRRESNGAHLASIAPMIKESHRIALCVELFVPLVRGAPVPVCIAPALGVLRGAERHLGRWLALAEVATRAGDPTPLEEATSRAAIGPASARAAWALVAWALQQTKAKATAGALPLAPPSTRPTVELVARLSDRPSADKDTTFLFRLAKTGAPSCKPMLEALAKTLPLSDEVALRAAAFLARDHGREDMRDALLESAKNPKRDELRGLAAAALWDTGTVEARRVARDVADELVVSRSLTNVAWGALVRAAAASTTNGAKRDGAVGATDRETASDDGVARVAHVVANAHTSAWQVPVVIDEAPFRWVQWGWLE